MKAEFSEFTYGFSLVSELAKTMSLSAVPIFPSLLEEGKKGGGYDAKLKGKSGIILNLQFKLSDWMKASNAREYGIPGHTMTLPYYRFEITSKRVSEQQSLLLALEAIEPFTFYVAPAFHTSEEINTHWLSSDVAKNSVYLKPSTVGVLPDMNPHRICFDNTLKSKGKAYFFSEPKEIEVDEFSGFADHVTQAVTTSSTALMDRVDGTLSRYREALLDARRREDERAASVDDGVRQLSGRVLVEEALGRLDGRLLRLDQILASDDDPDDSQRLWQMAQVSTSLFGVQTFALFK
ncbi:hypothetical protein [Ruegeria profundi]|uniref:hypothetical protein n=1 Tax=Ruegeria profundi TaxID=1685378 RepID=UPI001CD2BBE3|nr:hypothetical protein [Ruegeria profundi]MCA0929756.1 hypothetical protein [Ruegeria profundi]